MYSTHRLHTVAKWARNGQILLRPDLTEAGTGPPHSLLLQFCGKSQRKAKNNVYQMIWDEFAGFPSEEQYGRPGTERLTTTYSEENLNNNSVLHLLPKHLQGKIRHEELLLPTAATLRSLSKNEKAFSNG